MSSFRPKKKNTKINFLGPEIAISGGRLPRSGVVVQKFVPSLESLFFLGDVARNLPGCPRPPFSPPTPIGCPGVCTVEQWRITGDERWKYRIFPCAHPWRSLALCFTNLRSGSKGGLFTSRAGVGSLPLYGGILVGADHIRCGAKYLASPSVTLMLAFFSVFLR